MAETSKISPELKQLMKEGLFKRLPPTFSTYFYDRIEDWKRLFPAERNYFERLFALLDRSESAAVEQLFAPLRAIEAKMGINENNWSRGEFTLEHVDFLQRSPHLAEWRSTITGIFAQLDPLLDEEVARSGHSRLVIVISPAELPTGPDRMWTRLRDRGTQIPLALGDEDALNDYLSLILTGAPRSQKAPTLFDLLGKNASNDYDNWVIEAGDPIHRLATSFSGWTGFSYDRLKRVREALMEEVDKMVTREQIPGPRQLGERLKRMNPGELRRAAGRDPILGDFLQSVLLNGNGTLLINNTFVEWASMQVLRRARPTLLCASFGIRTKVKPFSSLLIYADQEEANPIPTQADMLGTYVDLEIFYQYIWQECEKYAEYRRNTAYLFVGEGMDALFAIAPPDFPLLNAGEPVPLAEVFAGAKQWLSL
ncbi:MAG: hypothetical protein WD733_12460 [Bryobacterales bacterium]